MYVYVYIYIHISICVDSLHGGTYLVPCRDTSDHTSRIRLDQPNYLLQPRPEQKGLFEKEPCA